MERETSRLEAALRRQAARALGVPEAAVLPDRPLLSLGLDSLAAVELSQWARAEAGAELPLAELLDGGSVRSLARLLTERGTAGPEGEEQGEGGPPVPELSVGERGLWWIDRRQPGSAAYHLAALARLGPCDLGRLRAALDGLAQRHEILRTVYREGEEGEPRREVLPPGNAGGGRVGWTEVEVLPPAGGRAGRRPWWEELVERLAWRPFDLARGPLVRAAVLTRGADRADRAERIGRADRVGRTDRVERAEHKENNERAGHGERLLLLTFHHIVTDFWSLGLLAADLAAVLADRRDEERPDRDRPAAVDEDRQAAEGGGGTGGGAARPRRFLGQEAGTAPPYSAYTAWQRRRTAGTHGAALAGLEAAWCERLAGLPALALPLDRPRRPLEKAAEEAAGWPGSSGLAELSGPSGSPGLSGSVGPWAAAGWAGCRWSVLPPAETAALRQLARRCGTTLYAVLLAALAVLLRRLSGQDDFAVLSPLAGRPAAFPLVAGTAGYFVNPLPVRLTLGADAAGGREPGFGAAAGHVRERLIEALDRQDLPLPRLVERLRREGGEELAEALGAVLFVLHRRSEPEGLVDLALGEEGPELALGGLRLTPLRLAPRQAQFDLSLAAGERRGGLGMQLVFRRDLLDGATAGRWLESFTVLLGALAGDGVGGRYLGAGDAGAAGRRGAAARGVEETPLGDLPLLSAAQRQQLIEWNAPAALPWGQPRADGPCLQAGADIPALFAAQAALTPERVAVVCGEASLTYGALAGTSRRVAATLQALGTGPERVVAVAMGRCPELLPALLGVLRAGAAYLPLEPGDPDARLAARMGELVERLSPAPQEPAKSAISAMLEASAAPEDIAEACRQGDPPAPAGPGAPLLVLTTVGERERLERLAPPGCRVLAVEPAGGGEAPLADPGLDGENLAYVFFTSGSTGRPKAAMNRHAGIANRLLWMQDTFGLGGGDRVLQKTPLGFDVSVWELFSPLVTGGGLVLAPPGAQADPEALLTAVAAHQVTIVHFVPSLLQALLEAPGLGRAGSLRAIVASGEALPAALARRCRALLPAPLFNLYGPTEAAVEVTAWRCGEADAAEVPIGRPIANLEISILDAEGREVPPGAAGELAIGGAGLARGYLGRPDLTAERFVPDGRATARGAGGNGADGADRSDGADGRDGRREGGLREGGARLYRSGDRARLRADGAVLFLGRLDHQVKVRGVRIEPGEIEAALARHPAVGECVVLAVAGEPEEGSRLARGAAGTGAAGGGLRLVACVAAPAADTGDERRRLAAELRAFARQRLPEVMVPGSFVLLPALPLNANGKVDRRALSSLAADAGAGGAPSFSSLGAAPRGQVEELLAGLWAELLEIEPAAVSRNSSFFDLGGHSLLASRLTWGVRRTLGVELPVQEVFTAPRLAELARRVAHLAELAAAVTVPAAAAGPASPSAGRPWPPHPGPGSAAVGEPAEAGGGRAGAHSQAEAAVASWPQQWLWTLERLQPGGAYHMPAALALSGPLAVPALAWALGGLEARHDALRTVFDEAWDGPAEEGPRPLLLPLRAGAGAALAVIDLSRLPEARRRREAAAALGAREAARPFDLARGPVWRTALLRLEPGEHVLLITLHHIAADGWSAGILAHDISRLYAAARRGEPADLAPPPLRYADFARRQRREVTPASWAAEVAAARQRLAGAEVAVRVPADRPERPESSEPSERPEQPVDAGPAAAETGRSPGVWPPRPAAVRPGRAGQLALRLDESLGLAAELRRLAVRARVTPFMVWLTALGELTGRMAGADDLCVGTPVAGREREETAAVVGCFVNTAVVRLGLGGSPPVAAALARTRAALLDATLGSRVPFDRLVEELAPRRDRARPPYFSVLLAAAASAWENLALDGLTVRRLPLPAPAAQVDLTLILAADAGAATWEYRADLFDAVTVRRLGAHLTALLAGMAARPEGRLDELPVWSAAERHQLTVETAAGEPGWTVPRRGGVRGRPERRGQPPVEALAAGSAPECGATSESGSTPSGGAIPEGGAESAGGAPGEAPRGPLEEMVAEVWAGLLGVRPLRHADLFGLGVHSLLGARALSRLGAATGVALPLAELFAAPTVAGLARRIEARRREAGSDAAAPLPPVERRAAAEAEAVPMAPAQERLWFLERLRPGSPAYHMPLAFDLDGPLRPAALAAALAAVVRRHEALRSTLHATPSGPVMRPAPWPAARSPANGGEGAPREGHSPTVTAVAPAAWTLPLADLADLPAARREAAAGGALRALALPAFDLGRGPLWRALALRLAAARHLLLVVVHHLVFDGVSAGILAAEAAALHGAAAAVRHPELAPLPVQYGDYALWQRRLLREEGAAGEALARGLDFWRRELAELPAWRLPGEAPAGAGPGFAGGAGAAAPAEVGREAVRRHLFRLDAPVTEPLRRASRRHGATAFMAAAAGFAALLARVTGERDVSFATPVGGRQRPELDGLIGLFINTVVLRFALAPDPSFAALLRRAAAATLAAHDHGGVPFDRVVEMVRGASGAAPAAALDRVIFTMAGRPEAREAGGGLTLRPLAMAELARLDAGGAGTAGASKCDLLLAFEEQEDGALDGLWEARTGGGAVAAPGAGRQAEAGPAGAVAGGRSEGDLPGAPTEERGAGSLASAVDGKRDARGMASTAAGGRPAGRLEPETLARLSGWLGTLLAAAAADPERPLSALPLLAPAELHQLLREWSDPADGAAAANVLDLFAAQTAVRPGAVAVTAPAGGAAGGVEVALTYLGLDTAANRLAHHLRALGARPDRPVAVLLPRSAAVAVALLAVLKAGGAYAPLDPEAPPHRTAALLLELGRPPLVTLSALAARLGAATVPGEAGDVGGVGGIGGIGGVGNGEEVSASGSRSLGGSGAAGAAGASGGTGDDGGKGGKGDKGGKEGEEGREEAGLPAWGALVCLDAAQDRAAIAAQPAAPPERAVAGPAQAAAVFFTSGSTGRPKGVTVTHRGIVRLLARPGYARLGPDEVLLQLAPLSFDVATFEVWGALLHGGRLRLPPAGTLPLPALAAELAAQQVTTLWLTAGLFHATVDEAAERLGRLPALRQLLAGGDALSPAHVARALAAASQLTLINGYGPTEVTTFASCHTVCREEAPLLAAGGRVPIGRPIAETTARVLDDSLLLLPAGAVGELFLGGAGVARGYAGRPDLTAERFLPDPLGPPGSRLYRTGDLARWRHEGILDMLGRRDRQVKIRGFRVEPGEVEAALAELPQVAAAAVAVAGSGAAGGERRLVACVVLRTAAAAGPAAAAVLAALRRRLPEFLVPDAVVSVPALPLTPRGKVDREALLRLAPWPAAWPVESGVARAAGDPGAGLGRGAAAERAPAGENGTTGEGEDPLAAAVAAIWQDLLGVEVGTGDSVLTLGAHSLVMLRAGARLEEAFGVELPLSELLMHRTPAELARRLTELRWGLPADPADGAAEEPLLPAGAGERAAGLPLSFAQQRMWTIEHMAPGEPAYNLLIAANLEGPLDPPGMEPAGTAAAAAGSAGGAGSAARSAGSAVGPLEGRHGALAPLDALTAAWSEVVRRHEILRTTFELPGEGSRDPVQRAAPAPPGVRPLPRVDLAALPAARRAAEVRALAARLGRGAFDLGRGPLVRVALVRSAAASHDLLIAMHHIVCDEWSLRRLLHEIAALYGAFAAGRPSPLAALGVQYGDWAAWQRRRHAGGRLDAPMELWRRRLTPSPPPLDLPADRPRPAVVRYRGARRPVALAPSGGTLGGLLAGGRRSGATPFMVLLAAFAGLLARLSGQEDFALGTPITGRGQSAVEPLLGCFLNTLAVRLEPAPAEPFSALLARVRERALEAFALREVPFERLVDELHPRRGLDRAPFFQVLFVLLHWPEAPAELPGLRLRPWDVDLGTAKFDLTLSLLLGGATDAVDAADGELRGTIEYSTDLFDAATVDRLGRHLGALLESAAAHPGRPLGALDLLPAAERHQVAHEWRTGFEPRRGAAPGLVDLFALFAACAAAHPERVALAGSGGRGSWQLTYDALRQRVERLAAALRSEGVGPETVVGVCAGRGPELPPALLAVLAAGGAYLPIDPALPPARIAAMLADAGVTVMVAARSLFPGGLPFAGTLADTRDAGAARAAAVPLPAVDRPPLRRIVWLEEGGDEHGGWEENRTTEVGWEARHPAALDGGRTGGQAVPSGTRAADRRRGMGLAAAGWAAPDPEQLAYAIFTSGSTGQPKGVGLPHRALANLISWQLAAAPETAGARTLQFAAPGFDVSLQEILATLCGGGALVLAGEEERLDPERLLAHLALLQVERLFLPFVALQGLADQAVRGPAGRGAELPPLRTVVTAGERLQVTPQIAAFWRRLEDAGLRTALCNQYGPSETHVVTEHVLTGDPAGAPTPPPSPWPQWPPIGRPLPGTVCRVLGPFRDGFTPQPAGVAGELAVGGLAAGRCYLGRPDLTAVRFVPDPCADGADGAGAGRLYRTGDLARFRADGTIEFLGRIDQQVKIRGYRVEPGEIEAVLARVPGVSGCAVVVREDRPGDRRVVAYLVAGSGNPAGSASTATLPPGAAPAGAAAAALSAWLREQLRQSLPGYMIPSAFVFLAALPRTVTGKVDRRALPALPAELPEPGALGEPENAVPAAGAAAAGGLTAAVAAGGAPAAPGGGALLPRTVIERQVAEAVRAALDGAAVGVEENLFDAGAHSLTMVRAAALLSDRVGRRVPVIDFFRFPTIAALSRHLAAAGGEPAPATERPGADGNGGRPAGDAPAAEARAVTPRDQPARRAAERRQAADLRRDRRDRRERS